MTDGACGMRPGHTRGREPACRPPGAAFEPSQRCVHGPRRSAVVGDEHDQCVSCKAKPLESSEDFTHAPIHFRTGVGIESFPCLVEEAFAGRQGEVHIEWGR